MVGVFCINRFGKLELRKYDTDPVVTFSNKHRFSSSILDFITRYTAVGKRDGSGSYPVKLAPVSGR